MSCGTHRYGNIDQQKITLIISELKTHGCSVSGNNPWAVDTHQHGIKLKGQWDRSTSTLSVSVTDKGWYVPCSKIWDYIDPMIHHIQDLTVNQLAEVEKEHLKAAN